MTLNGVMAYQSNEVECGIFKRKESLKPLKLETVRYIDDLGNDGKNFTNHLKKKTVIRRQEGKERGSIHGGE